MRGFIPIISVSWRTEFAIRREQDERLHIGCDAKEQPLNPETFMTQQTKNPNQKPVPTHPFPAAEASKQKLKAETLEVAGRHKNDGQKDHKGAR